MSGARGHARQPQRNDLVRGTDPPQFARASQNIAAAAMLLRDLSEPNDPHEQVTHRNLRALVETTAVQQAESSISRRQLVTSLTTRGMGTRQTGRSTRSPRRSPSAAQEAALAPHLDLTTAPYQPPIYTRLGPN